MDKSELMNNHISSYVSHYYEIVQYLENSAKKCINQCSFVYTSDSSTCNNEYKVKRKYLREEDSLLLKINRILEKQSEKNRNSLQYISDRLKTFKTKTSSSLQSVLKSKLMDTHSEKLVYFQNDKQLFNTSTLLHYPSSTIYKSLLDINDRTDTCDIYSDYHMNYISVIYDYMNGNDSYIQNIQKLSNDNRNAFFHELLKLKLSINISIFYTIYNKHNKYGIGWKNRCVFNEYDTEYYNKLFSCIYDMHYGCLQYDKNDKIVKYLINTKELELLKDITQFLNDKQTNKEFIKSKYTINHIDSFLDSLTIDKQNPLINNYLSNYTSLLFYKSLILDDNQYDNFVNECFDCEYQWKLLYRTSEHEYTAKSFHEYCDDKGPTLIIIKSIEGWIFGGFTSKSWKPTNPYGNGGEYKNDVNAFIFTLKNAYSVPPTKFNRLRYSEYSIECDPVRGPIFRGDDDLDIFIDDKCNDDYNNNTTNKGTGGFECHPIYRSSLFVNTEGPEEINPFSVLDYEVYTIVNYNDYIKNTYTCGELILEYKQTNRINCNLIPQGFAEMFLLFELSEFDILLNSENQDLLFKHYYTPSDLLPKTHIVDKQYDHYINEWVGHEYKWKLIYRTSEHEYSAKSFHRYCDKKKPTLIIIKSSYGCVFGGYVTKLWKGNYVNKNDLNAFIFTLKNTFNVPPTKFNKRVENDCAMSCDSEFGPIFGDDDCDILIGDKCYKTEKNWIENDGHNGYECNPEYIRSLFVCTAPPNEPNYFSVLDYEVYAIDGKK